MIFAVLLTSGALVILAWLVFNLAVYALPFFVGMSAASWAHAHGSGIVGAGIIGLIAGALTLAVGQTVSATTRSPVLRLAILAVYLVPAAIAGFAATNHVAAWTVTGEVWRTSLAVFGATVTTLVAYARLTSAPPGGPGGASWPEPPEPARGRDQKLSPRRPPGQSGADRTVDADYLGAECAHRATTCLAGRAYQHAEPPESARRVYGNLGEEAISACNG